MLDYAEYHHTFIAAVLGTSSHDVFAAQKFIDEHRDEVMRDYEKMLERDRRGNPPEIRVSSTVQSHVGRNQENQEERHSTQGQ